MSEKSKRPEFSLSTVLANDATKKQLLGFIEEIILSEGKIKSEREALSDIKKEAETSLGIPASLLGDLVKEKLDQGHIEAKIKKLEESKDMAIGLGITEE